MTTAHAGSDPTTADRLLRAAAMLFRTKGFSGTSTRELSEALGIQKASLYHHIRSKDDLLFRICTDALESIRAAVVDAGAGVDLGSRLEVMIVAHVRTALEDRDLHATMLTELRALSDDRREQVLQARDAYQHVLSLTVAESRAAGLLRSDVTVKHLTLALLNLLNWTIFWYDPDGEDSPAEIGDLLATIFLEGARAR